MRLIATLAALVTVAVTARLGWWQLDRAAQKDALQAAVESRAMMPALDAPQLLKALEPQGASTAPASATRLHHRPAVLIGRWATERLVFLENRPMNGRAGFIALMPLVLPDGQAILVQRGWQPRDLRDRLLTRPVPSSEDRPVRVRGRLAPPPSRLMEFDGAASGTVRQNVDLAALSSEFGLRLLPLTLVQLEPAMACDEALTCVEVVEDHLLRDWPVVASSSDKNRGYAVQWFSLSALVLVLFLWFQFIQPWRRARRAL